MSEEAAHARHQADGSPTGGSGEDGGPLSVSAIEGKDDQAIARTLSRQEGSLQRQRDLLAELRRDGSNAAPAMSPNSLTGSLLASVLDERTRSPAFKPPSRAAVTPDGSRGGSPRSPSRQDEPSTLSSDVSATKHSHSGNGDRGSSHIRQQLSNVQQFRRVVERKDQQIRELREEVAQLRTAREDASSLRAAGSVLEDRVKLREAELVRKAEQLAQVQAERSEVERRLRAELAAYKSHAEEARAERDRLYALKQQEFEEETRSMRNQGKALEAAAAERERALREEAEQLSTELARVRERERVLTRAAEEMETRERESVRARDAATGEVEALRRALRDRDELLAQHARDRDSLSRQREEHEGTIATLQNAVAELRDRLTATAEEADRVPGLAKEVTALRPLPERVRELQRTLDTRDASLRATEEQWREAEEEAEKQQSRAADAEAALSSTRAQCEALQAVEAQNEALRRRLEDAQKEADRRTQAMEALERDLEQASRYQRESDQRVDAATKALVQRVSAALHAMDSALEAQAAADGDGDAEASGDDDAKLARASAQHDAALRAMRASGGDDGNDDGMSGAGGSDARSAALRPMAGAFTVLASLRQRAADALGEMWHARASARDADALAQERARRVRMAEQETTAARTNLAEERQSSDSLRQEVQRLQSSMAEAQEHAADLEAERDGLSRDLEADRAFVRQALAQLRAALAIGPQDDVMAALLAHVRTTGTAPANEDAGNDDEAATAADAGSDGDAAGVTTEADLTWARAQSMLSRAVQNVQSRSELVSEAVPSLAQALRAMQGKADAASQRADEVTAEARAEAESLEAAREAEVRRVQEEASARESAIVSETREAVRQLEKQLGQARQDLAAAGAEQERLYSSLARAEEGKAEEARERSRAMAACRLLARALRPLRTRARELAAQKRFLSSELRALQHLQQDVHSLVGAVSSGLDPDTGAGGVAGSPAAGQAAPGDAGSPGGSSSGQTRPTLRLVAIMALAANRLRTMAATRQFLGSAHTVGATRERLLLAPDTSIASDVEELPIPLPAPAAKGSASTGASGEAGGADASPSPKSPHALPSPLRARQQDATRNHEAAESLYRLLTALEPAADDLGNALYRGRPLVHALYSGLRWGPAPTYDASAGNDRASGSAPRPPPQLLGGGERAVASQQGIAHVRRSVLALARRLRAAERQCEVLSRKSTAGGESLRHEREAREHAESELSRARELTSFLERRVQELQEEAMRLLPPERLEALRGEVREARRAQERAQKEREEMQAEVREEGNAAAESRRRAQAAETAAKEANSKLSVIEQSLREREEELQQLRGYSRRRDEQLRALEGEAEARASRLMEVESAAAEADDERQRLREHAERAEREAKEQRAVVGTATEELSALHAAREADLRQLATLRDDLSRSTQELARVRKECESLREAQRAASEMAASSSDLLRRERERSSAMEREAQAARAVRERAQSRQRAALTKEAAAEAAALDAAVGSAAFATSGAAAEAGARSSSGPLALASLSTPVAHTEGHGRPYTASTAPPHSPPASAHRPSASSTEARTSSAAAATSAAVQQALHEATRVLSRSRGGAAEAAQAPPTRATDTPRSEARTRTRSGVVPAVTPTPLPTRRSPLPSDTRHSASRAMSSSRSSRVSSYLEELDRKLLSAYGVRPGELGKSNQ